MALSDDIDQIKTLLMGLSVGQKHIRITTDELSNKIDGIKSSSNGNTTDKTRIFNELTVLLNFIAKGKKLDAILIVRRLTECGLKEAKNLVEIIHVADRD